MNLLNVAAGILESIVPVAIAIIWVAASIYNAVQEQKKKSQQRQPEGESDDDSVVIVEEQPRPGQAAAPHPPSTAGKSVQERLREIAEYRRRQMEQRGQGEGQAPAAPQPVAMPERRPSRQERQREAQAKREMAEKARRKFEQRQKQQEAIQRRQAEEAAQARREAQRKAAAEARAAESDRQRAADLAEHAGRVGSHSEQLAAGMKVHTTPPGFDEEVHRHVTDADAPGARIKQARVTLNRKNLRAAMVLKEILDPPVSMR